ncbi:MAG: phosphoribosylformylglycinamidine synthase [Deltaproteobacteria bacterium CG_4_10_14_3_um_filter_60_8]|nr:MAG: phosphoribosylformylglycinamidine synthase [Desulfobacterales bacterium CG2_30_60_27]PIP44505.1 MAG: phosphoribosylformylglycinamidine synthase [Deltaproteobacteria bacterium CG23_combo_of_CG06-09_8_20_14_all_60_8]PIY22080.1 MAG: phosphoribosylformylglycinamidine synthase [Deltaproteobacteria bacterium CG_4_10_14_3_um_filter_60_8]
MATSVKAIVLTGYGTNCEMEMAHACRLGGADQVDIVHLSELGMGKFSLDQYHFLNLPGGFLDGDDLGAGQAGAHRWKYATIKANGERLQDQLQRFIGDGKLILGVCNGFQLMVKAGLLPGFDHDYATRALSLTHNDSGRFEDRWVTLKVDRQSPCVFTRGLDTLYFPVRHGEGKFVAQDQAIMTRLGQAKLIALRYVDPATGAPTETYPHNPNGSPAGVAGICDPTGRLFGLMPHPEAFLHRTNHPRWTREELPEEGQGVQLFRNAVDFIRGNL